jgi:hypothetical protein
MDFEMRAFAADLCGFASPAGEAAGVQPAASQAVGSQAVGSGAAPPPDIRDGSETVMGEPGVPGDLPLAPLPPAWPDPTGLIPDSPSPQRRVAEPQSEPILTHTRIYRGNDRGFTERLEKYVATSDDARIGGWQGYLTRSDDFIRFCCHLHLTEMLELRGAVDQSDLILRWPISRYSSQ